jgi:CRISPR-associated protein Csc1
MTIIYRCQVTLQEATFFSSREISNSYFTDPYIGNYALAYALGMVQSPYFNKGEIHYPQHLAALNERGIYVTPATFINTPQFTFGQFNAQADAYWSAFANNAIVTRPDGGWMEKSGPVWYVNRPGEKAQKVGLENRPQFGRIRLLAIGNTAVFYIISQATLTIPRYIRLGKFMSKTHLAVTEHPDTITERQNQTVTALLNPADIPATYRLAVFDLLAVPPTPLIQHAILSGSFYTLPDAVYLPVGMRFGVEQVS